MSSIVYELAVVEDRGPYWQVTNVTKNTLDNLANREEKLIKLSYMSYVQIEDALMNKKVVRIKKSMMTDEVLPGEFEVIDLGETDFLQEVRNATISKIRMLVTPDLAKISGFALYGFIILNNDLSNAGYFITNDNREEKYLEILETGDEKLIQKLEDYLNYKDEIESVAQLERKFAAFRSEVRVAATPEEIEEIEQRFLERFYTNF
jgi:N-methylhydantoinase A/oxoprolinase/acetone carboxylase beta subunit